MLYTTINKLKGKRACESGLKKVLRFVGPNFDKDKNIPLTDIIKSNGIVDAIWALRATTECGKETCQSVAIFCAEESLPYFEKQHPNDSRVRDCIEAAKKYISREIGYDELIKCRSAARAAAEAAYGAYAAYAAYAAATAAAEAAYAAYADADDAYDVADAAYGAYGAYDVAATTKEFKAKLEIKFKELLAAK